MKAFLRHVLIPLLALTVISLVIWFAGPLLSFAGWVPLEHPYWRIALILLLFVWWIVRKLRLWMLSRRYNEELAQQVVEPDPEEGRASEEVQLLQERLREAIEVLKKARLGGAGEHKKLYQIPWYLIIGPPGSGKTTALVNSGLKFPLADRFGVESLKGVGGTRHCDWWFTDEAVLIDTAGRYTTQDSDRGRDARAWKGFLGLLKRYRKRQPINGAVVAISVSDLLGGGEEGLRDHAQAVRSRLQELRDELGIQFPVYVVFTKCDLLAGFNEFFDDVGRTEREQVWGVTFDISDSRSGQAIERAVEEFDALAERLSSQVVDKLQHERSETRRQAIYRFPQQFASIRPLFERFLNEAFSPSRYEHPIQLRGTYFTSATQEGTPIDRIMGALSRSFGLAQPAGTDAAGRGRSYFLTRLLRDVVFSEAALAGIDTKGERRRRLAKWAAITATTAVVVVVVALWAVSYSRNMELVNALDEASAEARVRLDDIAETPADLDEILRLLDRVRALPAGYAKRDADPPRLSGFGLYQGDKLGQVASEAYIRLLHKMLLPQMIYRIEDRLRQNIDAQEFLYETLKTYLMLERPEHYEAEHVQSWYLLDLERFPPDTLSHDQYPVLVDHVEALFAELKVPIRYSLDEELVARVRGVLREVSLANRVVERLEIEADYNRDIRPFRLEDRVGPQVSVVFSRRSGRGMDEALNGLYTYRGYHELFKPELRRIVLRLFGETWVIGDEQRSRVDEAREVKRLIDEVRALYFERFTLRWQELLGDLEIAAFAGTLEAVEVLRVAAGSQSPIRELLAAVREETGLGRREEGSAIGDATAELGERVATRRLSRLLPRELRGQVDADTVRSASSPEDIVEARFEPVARLAGDGDPSSDWPIDQSLGLLRRLAVTFEDATTRASSQLGSTADLTRSLRENALTLPDPVDRWMQSFAQQIARLTRDDRGSELRRAWASSVLPVCREVTGQHFPFDPASGVDLSVREFGRMFGHGGLIDEFFSQRLEPLADTGSSPWRWRQDHPVARTLNPQSIRVFEQAARIREAFFPEGGQRMVLQLDFRPEEMDESINRATLSVGEQRIEYFHGPVRTTTVRWPDSSNRSEVRIQFDPPSPQGRSSFIQDGPWALLRFLDQFVQAPGDSADSVRVDVELAGRTVRYMVRSHSLVNPITGNILQQFRCQGTL